LSEVIPSLGLKRVAISNMLDELQREQTSTPATIPMRVWRHLYFEGRTPQGAVDRAAVSAHNVRSPADRLRKR
jgi:hypothetical protein